MNAHDPRPSRPLRVCSLDDLLPFAGVAAVLGDRQVALFYLPGDRTQGAEVFAIGNYDPCSRANVLSRGIVGDKDGQPVVASPLYKQHFSLITGHCIEDPEIRVPVFDVTVDDGQVLVG